MIKSGLFNKKGSIILWVLLLMSLLSILGMIMISNALINYRNKKLIQIEKNLYYIGEGMGELGYETICLKLKKSIEDGLSYVNFFISEEMQESTEEYILEDGIPNDHLISHEIEQKLYEGILIGLSTYLVEPKQYQQIVNDQGERLLHNNGWEKISISADFTSFQPEKILSGGLKGQISSNIKVNYEEKEYEVVYLYEILIPSISLPYESRVDKIEEGEGSIYDLQISILDTAELFHSYKQWVLWKVVQPNEG